MVLCLLSRDSHGDTTKLNHEETVRGPEIAISPEKSEILLLPPVTINSPKLDLGATAPPHDGNHSTCGYLGVISAVISGEMWIVRYKALRAQLQKIHHEKNFGNW